MLELKSLNTLWRQTDLSQRLKEANEQLKIYDKMPKEYIRTKEKDDNDDNNNVISKALEKDNIVIRI